MGTYINPGNAAFKRISGPNYIDETMCLPCLYIWDILRIMKMTKLFGFQMKKYAVNTTVF